MNHKHHDLIIAWAKGATIQLYSNSQQKWVDYTNGTNPMWLDNFNYRIKPKPDKENTYHVEWKDTSAPKWHQKTLHNLKLTFDGETGTLKKAEVINEA